MTTLDLEQGSALADMKRAEELEKVQEMDEEISDARGDTVPWEKTKGFDEWIREEREKDETMEWAHGKREIDSGFAQSLDRMYPAGEIANLAYDYTRELSKTGDERPDWEIRTEFYKKVYPELEGYLGSRLVKPNESPYEGLDEFLLGKDLQTSKQE